MLLDNAVVYALSGDEHADEAARQALVKLAAWPTYVHRHILDQGQFNLRAPLLGVCNWAVSVNRMTLQLGDHGRAQVDTGRLVASSLEDKHVP